MVEVSALQDLYLSNNIDHALLRQVRIGSEEQYTNLVYARASSIEELYLSGLDPHPQAILQRRKRARPITVVRTVGVVCFGTHKRVCGLKYSAHVQN